jgi:hypothetical protein
LPDIFQSEKPKERHEKERQRYSREQIEGKEEKGCF